MTGHRHPTGSLSSPQQATRRTNLAENPYAGQGPVVLDIGDDVGALVVRMPPAMEGLEIEIAHDDSDRQQVSRGHVAVVARPTGASGAAGAAAQHSVVFPSLPAGRYELWEHDGPGRLTVEVVGGAVAEARWPDGWG